MWVIFFDLILLYSKAKVKLASYPYFWFTTDLAFKLINNSFADVQAKSNAIFYLFIWIIFVWQFSKYFKELELICSFDATACVFYLELKHDVLGVKVTADDYWPFLRKFKSIWNEVYKDLLESSLICYDLVGYILWNLKFKGEAFSFHLQVEHLMQVHHHIFDLKIIFYLLEFTIIDHVDI